MTNVHIAPLKKCYVSYPHSTPFHVPFLINFRGAILPNTLSNFLTLFFISFFSLTSPTHHRRHPSSTSNLTTVCLRSNHHHRHLLRFFSSSPPLSPLSQCSYLTTMTTTTFVISHPLVSLSPPPLPSSSPLIRICSLCITSFFKTQQQQQQQHFQRCCK